MTHPHEDTPGWLTPARAEFAGLKPQTWQDTELLARLARLQQSLHARPEPMDDFTEPHWLRRLAWGAGGLGATAAVLLCAVLLLDPPGSAGTAHAAPLAGSGFIPLVPEREFRAALTAERGAAVWLQPAELPRERLALLGLPFDAGRADEPVRAELMLNPSGQVLAVRILN